MTDNPSRGKGDWNRVVMAPQAGFLSHFGHAFGAALQLQAGHLLSHQGQHSLQNFRSLVGESQNSALGKLSNITPKLLV